MRVPEGERTVVLDVARVERASGIEVVLPALPVRMDYLAKTSFVIGP